LRGTRKQPSWLLALCFSPHLFPPCISAYNIRRFSPRFSEPTGSLHNSLNSVGWLQPQSRRRRNKEPSLADETKQDGRVEPRLSSSQPASRIAPPCWRSILSLPVNVERFVERAHTRGADAIQLDLEDGVAHSEKDHARKLLPSAVSRVSQNGASVIVRINQPQEMAARDLEAAVLPGVSAITLPKVENPGSVRAISEAIAQLESRRNLPQGNIGLLLLIETPAAIFRLPEIASADARTVAMKLGSEDFALAAGMAPEPDGLLFPSMAVLLAARAAELLPLGFVGSIAEYQDVEAFRRMVRRARRLGFRGATVIHPRLVPVLNEEFLPPTEEIESARRVIDAYERAQASGQGAIQVDGKMVDAPVYRRARHTLAMTEIGANKGGTGPS
jgi:citrate lyase subunit beta/citryl-CoA lyase